MSQHDLDILFGFIGGLTVSYPIYRLAWHRGYIRALAELKRIIS